MHPLVNMSFALLCGSAAAQDIHKCVAVDGKVSYGQTPCAADAASASVLTAPAAPPPDPAAPSRLAHDRKLANALQQARLKVALADARDDARAARAGAAQQKKCGKLKLKQHWLEDDVRRASMEKAGQARLLARRAADTVALECGK